MDIWSHRRALRRPHLFSARVRDLFWAAVCGALLFGLALLHVEFPHGLVGLHDGLVPYLEAR